MVEFVEFSAAVNNPQPTIFHFSNKSNPLMQVRSEDIKIKDLERGLFKPSKKELKFLQRNNGDRERQYIYMDPIPNEMRSLILMELCTVQIDWKMLTTLRPKTKIEEEYYSKCVYIKQFVHFV